MYVELHFVTFGKEDFLLTFLNLQVREMDFLKILLYADISFEVRGRFVGFTLYSPIAIFFIGDCLQSCTKNCQKLKY